MELILLVAVMLFLIIIWLLGRGFEFAIGNEDGNSLIMGFFIYFSLFQMLALPMIFNLKPLTWITISWIVLITLCIISAVIIRLRKGAFRKSICRVNWEKYKSLYCLSGVFMLAAIFAQLYFALAQDYNGWDTAFYIPTVNTSLSTNTMYIYYGASGWKDQVLNLRYAISSFYMHDAVIGQIFHIHGAIVVRYFNTIICILLSAFIIYQIGICVFEKKEYASYMVLFWILANFGISTIYQANNFLLYRAYEAKTYCCNIIIPAVIYEMLLLYKNPDKKAHWINLFVINLSSVAISASSILLIPVLNFYMFLGYFIFNRKLKYCLRMLICLLPNMIYLGIYFLFLSGVYRIEIV